MTFNAKNNRIYFVISVCMQTSYNYFMSYQMTRCLRSYYYIVNGFSQTNKYTKSVSNLLQLLKKNAIYNDHYINAIQIKVCMGLVLQFVLDCTFITFEDQLHFEEKFIVVLLIKVHYLLFPKLFKYLWVFVKFGEYKNFFDYIWELRTNSIVIVRKSFLFRIHNNREANE